MIETENLTRRYDALSVVDQVSVKLPDGALIAIVGPNGAGKSTLLSMISRLMPASSGVALIDGLDVATMPTDHLAQRLAILRQDNAIAARITVRELVSFGRYPHSKGRLRPDDLSRIDDALNFLELQPYADRYLDEISGGQRQRAHIAMVLAQDTDYVLLDEPLNNLDMRHARAMMSLLRRAVDERGRTVVVVLHDINFASCYADHIVAMRDGRVVASGSPKDIVTSEMLQSIYDIDVEIVMVRGHRTVHYYR